MKVKSQEMVRKAGSFRICEQVNNTFQSSKTYYILDENNTSKILQMPIEVHNPKTHAVKFRAFFFEVERVNRI